MASPKGGWEIDAVVASPIGGHLWSRGLEAKRCVGVLNCRAANGPRQRNSAVQWPVIKAECAP